MQRRTVQNRFDVDTMRTVLIVKNNGEFDLILTHNTLVFVGNHNVVDVEEQIALESRTPQETPTGITGETVDVTDDTLRSSQVHWERET